MVGETTAYRYPQNAEEYIGELKERIYKEKQIANEISEQIYKLEKRHSEARYAITVLEMALDSFINIGKQTGPKSRKDQPRRADGKFVKKGGRHNYEDEVEEEEQE